MKILVVEDDLVTGNLLDKVLTKQGYAVTHVSDGAKALEALRSSAFRIILTDWMMPEMDGPTLCGHVRGLNLRHYVYVILLTAKSSKEDAVAGLESGADDFIVKPFDKSELFARIRAGQRMVELEDNNRVTHQKLSRSEKLSALGHLAAGVAHEINNPIGFISSNLNSLKGYMHDIRCMLQCYRELAQVLDKSISEKKLDAGLPVMIKKAMNMEMEYDIDFVTQDADELITDCTGGAERIKSIVHEMRYFAHPDHQMFAPCDLVELMKKAVAQFSKQQPPGVSIQNDLGQLPEIACNGPHMEQAFANIVQNAIDAVEGNGLITIDCLCRQDAIEIKITDSGKGIAPEHLAMVFDPFFTTKSVGQSVGLGLTTALNIVKMHNGSISCESNPDAGTSFTVSLPTDGSTECV